ncbi:hypothetical protein COCC4DRAFT_151733 [Bipolaris maydis ATCC 48331]|uniref:Phenylacetyl-CoA ligase n=2 Tax=Cochliobolus heterostrophus TaxID=5016 RepID=M2UC60_COCH5|nr:uncharacterized protein COCC4DRAFT_151733 [Bipolaris maydis ATCC 48331]EMD85583.1 hypothetical protein COCHEDRAFT_1118624 [Bipolaris maydis C5]KAJ5021182.1 hypothetical protein J3E73DRAFT_394940 [Bipolaris maydis]ENH99965.1 hypothetical protein COCC4DRAFT_151733 [Bipolaris maydis ATCC 48331]KAJ6265913.1 hypothetical protein PSV08DRAFT_375026 [Bipolaris maydis]KAJ6276710.1 hypothetical protein J3E71DRAFT_365419 [Bipolaris maydis]
MVFRPPKWVPQMPSIPDSTPILDFLLQEEFGRHKISQSHPPLVCGISGREYSVPEVSKRTISIAKSLLKSLEWEVNSGTQWEKVVGVFAFNSIDTLPVAWAVQRLNGIVTPVNAISTAEELTSQLRSSGAKALFTCASLLSTALKAADIVGIPRRHIFLLEVAADQPNHGSIYFRTASKLAAEGQSLPPLEPIGWSPGQAKTQVAFLCYSSGTSGTPKGVLISHYNVISNIIQMHTTERSVRKERLSLARSTELDIGICVLPLSHIYALVAIAHTSFYRGDKCVIMPKYEINSFLQAIEMFKVSLLYLVPPIVLNILQSPTLVSKYDLSTISAVFTAAAPLGKEMALALEQAFPQWKIRQAYGFTVENDISPGSSGSLVSGYEAKLLTPDGIEITALDVPGELYLRSPSITSLGYFRNNQASKETFLEDGWLRTGDEAMFRLSEQGKNEHLWITDRLKELIKVNGLQVAPSEIESHLLSHIAVADVCVIPIPDLRTGEALKAYIVKAEDCRGIDDVSLGEILKVHVQEEKARYKWLKEIAFVDRIPKSGTGKILRNAVKEWERSLRRQDGPRL